MHEREKKKTHPFPALKMKAGVSAAEQRAPIKAGTALIKLIWHAIPAASSSWPTFCGDRRWDGPLLTLGAELGFQVHSPGP
jgi:hypothetical protein